MCSEEEIKEEGEKKRGVREKAVSGMLLDYKKLVSHVSEMCF